MQSVSLILEGITTFVAIQVLVVGVLMLLDKRRYNRIIGVFLLLLSFGSLRPVMVLFLPYEFWNNLLWNSVPGFFYGPLLFLYCKQITGGKIRIHDYATHMIPAGILFFLALFGIFLKGVVVFSFEQVINGFLVFSIVLYSILVARSYVNNLEYANQQEKRKYKLILIVVFVQLFSIAIVLTLDSYFPSDLNPLRESFQYLNTFVLTVSSYLICILFFTEISWVKPSITPIRVSQQSSLSVYEEKLRPILNELQLNKPFRNAGFTIHDLASATGLNPHRISKIILSSYGVTFKDFMLQAQIDDFKQRIKEDGGAKFDLVSLATDSGFGSKAAFYRNFKRIEGMTPNEYVKQQHKINTH